MEQLNCFLEKYESRPEMEHLNSKQGNNSEAEMESLNRIQKNSKGEK